MTKHVSKVLAGLQWGKPIHPYCLNKKQFLAIESGCVELGVTVRAFTKWQKRKIAPPRYRVERKLMLFREDVLAIKSRLAKPSSVLG